MGNPEWVAIVVTIALAILGGFIRVYTMISATETRLVARINSVEVRQNRMRGQGNERLADTLSKLDDKLDGAVRNAEATHREFVVQARDMAITARDTFITRDDFKDALTTLHGAITELKKEVGGVHTRMDEIYRIYRANGGNR